MALPELAEEQQEETPILSLDTTDADDTLVPAARHAIHSPAKAVLFGRLSLPLPSIILKEPARRQTARTSNQRARRARMYYASPE